MTQPQTLLLIDPAAQTVLVLSLADGEYSELSIVGPKGAIASGEFPLLTLTTEQIFTALNQP